MTKALQICSVASLLVVLAACANVEGPPAPLSVVIVPSSVAATKDQTIFLSVTVKDSGGTSIVPDSVRWTSSDGAKATVSAAGVLRTLQATAPTVTVQATAFKGRAQGSGSIPVTIMGFPQ